VRDVLDVHLVESMDDVLRLALDGELGLMAKGEGKFTEATPKPPVGSDSLAH
jgi:hypothetical protein